MAEESDELAFTARANDPAGIDPSAFTLVVDGQDVTLACSVRTPRLDPVNRVDFSYRPARGWAPGFHRAEVGGPGRTPVGAWSFETR